MLQQRYFISACLLGQKVRYDGQDCLVKSLFDHLIPSQYVSLCPEVSGGLAIPRAAAEIYRGSALQVFKQQAQVIDQEHNDLSAAFIKGAYQALKIAQDFKVTHAILKANSPSCGSQYIFDGTFSAQKILADGLTAALFKQHGIQVMTEDEFLDRMISKI